MGEEATKLINIPLFKKTQHDRDTAMELDRNRQWCSYRGLDAVRPPLVIVCLLLGLLGFYVLRVLLREKRDRLERQRNANR